MLMMNYIQIEKYNFVFFLNKNYSQKLWLNMYFLFYSAVKFYKKRKIYLKLYNLSERFVEIQRT